MTRSAREILFDLDQAQALVNAFAPGSYDLRALAGEIANDVSSSYELALLPLIGENLTMEVNDVVGDYLVNNYGDN